jgi:hypothetical protein
LEQQKENCCSRCITTIKPNIENQPVILGANNTDLCIRVYDLKGNIIDNADVNVRWKKLNFNKKTQSYLDKKSNQKGLLKVAYNGFTAYYDLVMNNKRQSGQAEGLIKSYKPLMAQLAFPGFLVQNDTCYAIGKVLNYTHDTLEVKTKFEINGKKTPNNSGLCSNSLIDTLSITATTDTLTVKYYLETKDGYFDGEKRKSAVYEHYNNPTLL